MAEVEIEVEAEVEAEVELELELEKRCFKSFMFYCQCLKVFLEF